ncbi:MAG: hypothetical protein RRZ83_02775 [Alistipes sp.]
MKLTIDSSLCDLAPESHFAPSYDADALSSPESARKGNAIKLTLPRTTDNDQVFGSEAVFNARKHTAELTHDGARLHVGTVRLLSSSNREYRIEIRSGAAQWAKNAALGAFKAIPIDYTSHLTPTDISAGWRDASPVKFLPILRDSYEQLNSSTDLQPVLRMLSPDDYHPFLQVDALMRAIFTAAGYTVQSRFMESVPFRSLYMSGAYATRDTAAVEKRMGFCAVRLTTATAVADAVGRVYATPHGAGNIVGNLVETATPQSVDEAGVVHTEPYNNGNCFGVEKLKIVYRPTTSLSVGFEYHLRYTTDHRILTRERLKGFDSVNLGKGGNIPFRLPNRYIDRRSNLAAQRSYRVVVFDGTATAQFRLRYNLDEQIGAHWSDFTGRSAVVTTPAAQKIAQPSLFVQSSPNSWSAYEGDWALYDGYVGLTGQTTVEICVRTPTEMVSASSPKYFNTIFFMGADEGMHFTLHTQCSVRPLFSPAPAYGARVTMVDVAQHDVKQSVLLEAVQHLFNLRFYTDEQTKTVYIEPESDFWDESRQADWSGRTDFMQPIVWEDVALGVHESRTYGYGGGDGATMRLGREEGQSFGSWHVTTNSRATIEGDQKCINPLFSPTLSEANIQVEAPSALLMQVGDRDDAAGDGVNFAPRIVRYCGVHRLPAGERWNDPAGQAAYPLAAFHFAGDAEQAGFTLCFADRDGQQGLHRFYDRQESLYAAREHVTLTLRLAPHEYETLFTIDTAAPDIRTTFRITTNRGVVCATLRRMRDYNPATGLARCTFTLLSHD